MSRRFLILASLLLIGGLAFGWIAYRWVNAPPTLPAFAASDFRKNVAQPVATPIAAIDPSRQIRLAVGSLGLPDDAQNRELGDLITADLGSAKGLELVERQSLDRVLREAELSLSGLVRAKDAIRVGKLLRADWFLLGGVASAGGSNAVVARIVDARTGIMRDVDVFPYDKVTPQLAEKLAGFVRQSRQAASGSKPREYLAIGVFQDVSVNNRQADFPTQLRAHLTAAYRGTDMKLLEREYVEALLNEVHLDLAGLTEEGGTNPPPRMQSAFWLVDGYYQSYERTNFEVELVLNVQRIFGGRTRLTFRGQPGEVLFKQIGGAMETSFKTNTLALTPTRSSEARAQLNAGAEIMRFDGSPFSYADMLFGEAYVSEYQLRVPDALRRRRNVEEAMHAFQIALLLEPTNQETKIYLARCFRDPLIGRMDEARDLYRSILEESMTARWSRAAQDALRWSFDRENPEDKIRWFEAAAQTCTNPAAADFYRYQVTLAQTNIIVQAGNSVGAQQIAEARLFQAITNALLGNGIGDVGMNHFMDSFGTNQAAAARRAVELFPKLRDQAPELAPYFLTAIATIQVDTNAAIIPEFQRTLEEYAQHPDKVFKPEKFWPHISGPVYNWSFEQKLYGIAVTVMEGKIQAAAILPKYSVDISDEDKMNLAFARLESRQWQKALAVFETYSNLPVAMGNSGPWGPAFTVIRTVRRANFCRRQQGLPEIHDLREFDMGDPLLCLCTPLTPDLNRPSSTFSATADGLWIGTEGTLIQLDFNLKTNFMIQLPIQPFVPITALSVTSSNIWIGTDGGGLVEFDKSSHQFRGITEKDGLMQDSILSLHAAGDTLWIGYKKGLGRLDLPGRRVTSFTVSLNNSSDNASMPARHAALSLAARTSKNVWSVTRSENQSQTDLWNYNSEADTWRPVPEIQGCVSISANSEKLFVGKNGSGFHRADEIRGLGVSSLDFRDGKWRHFPAVNGLPVEQVTTVAADGQNLWVGGMGYIALVDTDQDKVLKFAYIISRAVDKIQVAGGYVWAQFDWHLYRAPLN